MWQCSRCGETVDGNFECCWNCGADRDGVPDPEFVHADLATISRAPIHAAVGNDTPIRSLQPIRLRTRLLFAATVLSALFAVTAWYDREIGAPLRRADAVERLIISLAHRRPPDMTRAQWSSAVAWTINLHHNSLLPFQADGPTIRAFERRLRAKLAGDVDMDTIHWIWDEYGELCSGGEEYQRFKPQMLEEISVPSHRIRHGIHVP